MKDLIEYFIKEGYLVSPKLIEKLENIDIKEVIKNFNKLKNKPLVINEDVFEILNQDNNPANINWQEFDRARVLAEKNKENKTYNLFLDILKQDFNNNEIFEEGQGEPKIEIELEEGNGGNVIILKNYVDKDKKREVQDFIDYFKIRYNFLKNILLKRQELQNAVSINRALNRSERETIAIIGLVNDKRITKNGNILITLEDPTGLINVVINKSRKELFELANDIIFDEVIGVTGYNGDRIIFVNEIFLPDISLNNELKKGPNEEYVAFTSDLQVGNKVFFEKNFLKFIDWINGNYGNKEQREIAKRVKYLFIPGDLVDGVGVYPDQEYDLAILDIYKQYEKLAEYLARIRKDIKIILSVGNHDAVRLAEPQPFPDKKMAPLLYEFSNVIMATNPSLVNIASTKDFSGFNILIYHGSSFFYIVENVESIRRAGRTERPDLIMKFLLQRRHLAPSHTATLYLPNPDEDPLLIEKIPDFFISGHLHKTKVDNYHGVTTINCSAWIDQTEDQKRRGIVPDPCKAVLVNLKTRDVKILNFNEI
ncbi:MAG: metallophosphoesterase [Nanoarchaeota archaeon]